MDAEDLDLRTVSAGKPGHFHKLVAEVERLRAQRDELRAELEEAHLARIEAQNPGIDLEEVSRFGARLRRLQEGQSDG